MAYDINPELCNPKKLKIEDMNKCELIFISVPIPMNEDSSCHLKIIQSVMNFLYSINYSGFIVLRSTVSPGTSNNLNCYFMPS